MGVLVGLAVALVLSNLAIVPAVLYAYVKFYFVELALLCGVFTASTAFHMCQVGWFCFGLELRALQMTDHLLVYTALVWFSLYFVGAPINLRMSLTFVSMVVMLPVISTFIGSWLSGAIIIAFILTMTLTVLVVVIKVHGGPTIEWTSLLIAAVLMGAGVTLHVVGGDYGEDNWVYPTAHPVWHGLSMLSILFVMRAANSRQKRRRVHNVNETPPAASAPQRKTKKHSQQQQQYQSSISIKKKPRKRSKSPTRPKVLELYGPIDPNIL